METGTITPELQQLILQVQKSEHTEALVYQHIAKLTKDTHNKEIILKIAEDEMKHYQIWKQYSKKDLRPNRIKVWLYTWITRLLGVTFGLKLMERGEKATIFQYKNIGAILPAATYIQKDEEEHELYLIDMINEKFLRYLGSIVLGLNDALVELTGVLAGLTFGLQNTHLVVFSGLITGIAAAMSMAGSEYLSTKTENDEHIQPFKAAVYTGIAYITTVVILIFPYFVLSNVYVALATTICLAILIIAGFNFYSSIAQ
jgi:VIT1/CCC1 family predicted Fe2+/Mn2+ transporter